MLEAQAQGEGEGKATEGGEGGADGFLAIDQAMVSRLLSDSDDDDLGGQATKGDSAKAADGSGPGAGSGSGVVSAPLNPLNLWRSTKFERKLTEQLSDPLAIATGALPPWVRWLPPLCPSLWSKQCRMKRLRFIGFGVSRAVELLQVHACTCTNVGRESQRSQVTRVQSTQIFGHHYFSNQAIIELKK